MKVHGDDDLVINDIQISKEYSDSESADREMDYDNDINIKG